MPQRGARSGARELEHLAQQDQRDNGGGRLEILARRVAVAERVRQAAGNSTASTLKP